MISLISGIQKTKQMNKQQVKEQKQTHGYGGQADGQNG